MKQEGQREIELITAAALPQLWLKNKRRDKREKK
jgi:hypothetical protein